MNKLELANLLNVNLRKQLTREEYEIEVLSPFRFFSAKRFDLTIKYLYAKEIIRKQKGGYYQKLYLEHIKAFNHFVENDDTNKVGSSDFLIAFEKLVEDMKLHGFTSVVPYSGDFFPLDGAHRIAAAAALGIKLKAVKLGDTLNSVQNYNSEYFRNRGLLQEYVDATTIEYAKLVKSTFMVLIWPRAIGKDIEIENILRQYGDIISKKQVRLTYNGIVNFQKIVYKHEKWLGTYNNDFEGVHVKSQQCYDENGILRAYLFESNKNLVEMKDVIRQLFSFGKHSIHINDTNEETIEIANLIFNDNAIHWLNCAKRNEMQNLTKYLNCFTNYIIENGIDSNKFAIIGGLLALYGIKDSKDLDYICKDDALPARISNEVELETKKIRYTSHSVDELIDNPRWHFVVNGLKFINLEVLVEIKKNRNNDSDKVSVEVMQKLLDNMKVEYSISEYFKRYTSIFFYRRCIKSFLLMCRYYIRLIQKKVCKISGK